MNKNVTTILIIILVLIVGMSFYYSNKKSSPTDTTIVDNKKQEEQVVVKLAPGNIVESKKTSAGKEYLTDTKGMTLYVFKNDGKMKSNCSGTCLKNWPAFVYDNKDFATSKDLLSKKMNVFKRTDGVFQYAFVEQPVYYYIGDKNPGDTNGDGLNEGKWSIVVIPQQ